MTQIYLINKASFCGYQDISQNIDDEKLNVFIKEAQDMDLKPFLGHALYYDFIKWFQTFGVLKNATPQAYKDLFNGCVYKDRQGNDVQYEGLVPTLVYFAFARFVEGSGVFYTYGGPVYKQTDGSTPLSVSERAKVVTNYRSKANAHANEVEKYFSDNRAAFPLWRRNEQNKSARQAGPRIRGIDRTRFNNPDAGQFGYGYGFNGFN